MNIMSFQEIIDSIEVLSVEEQNDLFELIKKRRTEKRRFEIANNAQATIKSLENETAKLGDLNDLRADLLKDDEE